MKYNIPTFITLETSDMSEKDKQALGLFISILESKGKLKTYKGILMPVG